VASTRRASAEPAGDNGRCASIGNTGARDVGGGVAPQVGSAGPCPVRPGRTGRGPPGRRFTDWTAPAGCAGAGAGRSARVGRRAQAHRPSVGWATAGPARPRPGRRDRGGDAEPSHVDTIADGAVGASLRRRVWLRRPWTATHR
jgi:hypothetical protein